MEKKKVHEYGELTFNKRAKVIQYRKASFFSTRDAETIGCPHGKKYKESCHLPNVTI